MLAEVAETQTPGFQPISAKVRGGSAIVAGPTDSQTSESLQDRHWMGLVPPQVWGGHKLEDMSCLQSSLGLYLDLFPGK